MLGRTEDKQEEEVREMEHHVTEMENESALSPTNMEKENESCGLKTHPNIFNIL